MPTRPLPLPEIATCADPREQHALLRGQPPHAHPQGWVVARRDDVAAALSCPHLLVSPTAEPDGPAQALRGRMARFSDGAEHAARRAAVDDLLPDADALVPAAWAATTAALTAASSPYDAMLLARTVPVRTMADALDVPEADTAVELVGQLCDALAPSLTAPPPGGRRRCRAVAAAAVVARV